MSYVQLGDYISRQTGARVATAVPGGFPQGFPQDGGDGDDGDGGWQPWMAPDSPWSRGQATADARRRHHGPLPQRGGHHVAHGGGHAGGHGGGRVHGLGYTHQQLASHFQALRQLRGGERGGQRGFERGRQRLQAHPFRLWGRHPMAPICTDPSCPMCTDPNFPGYNPSDPICQTNAGFSGLGYTPQELQAHFRNVRKLCASPGTLGFRGLGECMGALPVAPIIRGLPIHAGPVPIVGRRPVPIVGHPIVGHPHVNHPIIARSPGQRHGQERHGQRLPGWGARRNTGRWAWNNRRGWAPGTSNWAPWNVSPVCSDETSQYYNPADPSCATGAVDVNAAAATPAATDTTAAAPAYTGGGSSMPSWIWLAGGAVLLLLVMKK